jgi:hypothetical protein
MHERTFNVRVYLKPNGQVELGFVQELMPPKREKDGTSTRWWKAQPVGKTFKVLDHVIAAKLSRKQALARKGEFVYIRP